jgi:hypothetical protein
VQAEYSLVLGKQTMSDTAVIFCSELQLNGQAKGRHQTSLAMVPGCVTFLFNTNHQSESAFMDPRL